MNAITSPKSNAESRAVSPGLIAWEILAHDPYSLPEEEEDQLVCCPECWELAESEALLRHKPWCSGRSPAEAASF